GPEGRHEHELRISLEREPEEARPSEPLEPVRLVAVAAHARLADRTGIQHEESVPAQCRERLLRTARWDDLEACRDLAQHGPAEPAVLVSDDPGHAVQRAQHR